MLIILVIIIIITSQYFFNNKIRSKISNIKIKFYVSKYTTNKNKIVGQVINFDGQ